jgi:hypothetical protein
MKRFYEALGLGFTSEQHGAGPVHSTCRIGSTLFELYPASERSRGHVRLGLPVADIESAAAAGVQSGGRHLQGVGPVAPMVLEDPDQNQVELLPADAAFRLVAGANVLVPAILLLEEHGWSVEHHAEDTASAWRAGRDDIALVADDPLQLLALAVIADRRGAAWRATDAQIDDVLLRMHLADSEP